MRAPPVARALPVEAPADTHDRREPGGFSMEATEDNDVVVLHPAIAVTGRLLLALIFFFP